MLVIDKKKNLNKLKYWIGGKVLYFFVEILNFVKILVFF